MGIVPHFVLVLIFSALLLWFVDYFYCYVFGSVGQSCPTLCNPMDCSTPGFPVDHHLPEFAQTHVHRVSDAIQPSHPLSSPSAPASDPSQHQGLFQWVSSCYTKKLLCLESFIFLCIYLLQSFSLWLPWGTHIRLF